MAGAAQNYSAQQMTANLNIASKNAAKALGMGGILVDYSVGTHNGVFGFYMEKAKGMTPEAMKGFGLSRSSSGGGMSVKEIKNLPAEQKMQVKADLRRELNRMQWLDLVTGQADRHHANYFVHVDPTTHAVTVKGIDNDAGYSQYRDARRHRQGHRQRRRVFAVPHRRPEVLLRQGPVGGFQGSSDRHRKADRLPQLQGRA